MASDFPHVRRRPTRVTSGDPQRNSTVVRASVLETALELGLGQNSTVAEWIFNNPLSEVLEEHHPEFDSQPKPDSKPAPAPAPAPEPAEATTPTFTSGPNSVSDESSSLNSPANIADSAAATAIQVHTHKPSLTESPHVHFGDFSSDQLQLFSPFALSPRDAHLAEPGANASKSLPKGNERAHSQDDSLRRNPSRESPSSASADIGYTSEGQYLSKGNASKGKPGKSKGNKGSRSKVPDNNKASEKDGDYTSDGGYLSASSVKSQGKSPGRVRSRAMAFFRRRPKRSASDDEDEDSIPPVPALPVLPRPSSPMPLERRAAPSPTRPGFSPLTLNLTGPPASPPRRRASKSPPPVRTRATPPRRSDRTSSTQRPASPPVTSTSAPIPMTPAAIAATVPLPPSLPGTPLSTASSPPISNPSTPLGAGTAPAPKSSLTAQSSRQHLNIPPPAPPPTLPLPQLPPSPSATSGGMFPPLPATPTTPSRRGAPHRPIPVLPTPPGPTQSLAVRRTASPLRPLLSPRMVPPPVPHARNGESASGPEDDRRSGREAAWRQQSGAALSAGLGSTPAFLQRRIQYGAPPSPRPLPPDVPLPPSPGLRPRTPIGSPSKFHEHFSSVSSVPLSQVLTTSSRSPSMTTLSESFSAPSVRSSHVSSVSGRSEEPVTLNSRQARSTSSTSANSHRQPIARPAIDLRSQSSGRSNVSSSIYTPTMPRDSSSVTAYDDDADVEDATPKGYVDEEDDDASVYPSEDKTAGRRTMYLVEHGEMDGDEDGDGDGDDAVVAGSRSWGGHQVPPPLPLLPSKPTWPGPGYF